jgi:proliferating cell nuclear antigen PCNA|tara:strand:+ start:982 stop:1824 length:843 start_codon:yes stop_codon:yes gene_type:complete
MSCRLQPKNPKYFCDVIDAVSSVVSKTNIYVTGEGLKILAMDENRVSFIKLELEKNDFEVFDFSGVIKLGLDLTEFVKLLKSASGHNSLVLTYEDTNPRMVINFKNDGLARKYSVSLIDIDEEPPRPTNPDYYMELDISCKLFTNMINSVMVTGSEEIKFNIKDKKLTTFSKGDISETEFIFDKDCGYEDETKLKLNLKNRVKKSVIEKKKIYELISCEGDFSMTVNINMLKKMSRANTIIDTVSINMKYDEPLRLDYNLNGDGSFIYYYIAPKIEEEEY